MVEGLHLLPRHRKEIVALLHKHLPGVEVWAYGSRVNGRSHDGSDLDLVLRGPKLAEIDISRLADFTEALQDSTIPFLVEVRDWARLPESFHHEIEREHVVLVEREERDEADEWHQVRLGELCDLRSGSVFTPLFQGRTAGDHPFIKVSDMNLPTNAICIQDANNWVSKSDLRELKAKLLPKGTVVFAKIGEALRQNRRRRLVGETIIDNNMMGAVPRPDRVNPLFFYYALSQFDFSEVSQGTALPYLTVSTLSGLSLKAPSFPEQRAIAHILGTLDDKIELNHRMNETLEAMARALFKSWFVDFDPVRAKMAGRDPGLPQPLADLFPDRLVDSELGEMPEGWEVKALDELIELAYGKALREQERRPGIVSVYGSNGQVGWHDKKLVNGPGIIVGRKGNPGFVRWSPTDFYPIDTTFYVVPKDEKMGLYFLFHALKRQDLPSIAADSAVPGINRNLAYMNKQIVPPKHIVEQFSEYARGSSARRYGLDKESRTLAALRETLLPKLISGVLRVK